MTKRHTKPKMLKIFEYPGPDRAVRLVAAINLLEAAEFAEKECGTNEVRKLTLDRAYGIIVTDRFVPVAKTMPHIAEGEGAECTDFGLEKREAQ